MKTQNRFRFAVLAGAALLAACGGGGDDPVAVVPAPVVPEETRTHDSRTFAPLDPTATTFAAMTNQVAVTSRWAGVLNGAAYRVEVPANWNGKLVMYAHGFRGEGSTLTVSDPSIRRHLIESGYAWAASSYSTNYYDVRAGVEDTNALALAFNSIAAASFDATGDVWIFSQWSLHRTWLTPAMQGTRHSLEVRLTGQPQATLHTPLRPV